MVANRGEEACVAVPALVVVGIHSETVSAEQVDEYLRGIDEPKRTTLEALRSTILEIVPGC